MEKLISGFHEFRSQISPEQRKLFAKLAHKQEPRILFITCSDSRVEPHVLTHTGPGDLFMLRNAGNLVPPYGAVHGGEAASIEYAMHVLKVKHVIVCGHTNCGAREALIHPDHAKDLAATRAWLDQAEATRRIVWEREADHLDDEALVASAKTENILVQLQNLRTHPSVAVRLYKEEVQLHGWIYNIESGDICFYNPETKSFGPLLEFPQGTRA